MAYYQITARNASVLPVVSVSIGSIDQEPHVVDDIVIVNAIRNCLAGVSGVDSVVAQKYEQVITVI
ncbi:hypothetical protein [Streptomyces sp. NK08204]|uniref:hypothetical protein n=1 Tax=Streptomyces sp. NK08204 TaxID=2873260 RepID=UPI001CED2503|nr:hypothetical protein [Streptomyces sp. NK08204]